MRSTKYIALFNNVAQPFSVGILRVEDRPAAREPDDRKWFAPRINGRAVTRPDREVCTQIREAFTKSQRHGVGIPPLTDRVSPATKLDSADARKT